MKAKLMIIPALTAFLAGCSYGWNKEERSIINSGADTLHVYTVGNPAEEEVLRGTAEDFTRPMLRSAEYESLAQKMIATVKAPSQDGVGIAGPQVGIRRRIVAVQRFDKPGEPFEVYPNISIVNVYGEKVCGAEGCLSVPGQRGKVLRWQEIEIRYCNPKTLRDTSERISGFTAVIFQHECDHLQGVLYTDKLYRSARVENFRAEIVREYPHDEGSYTQGLFFRDGELYESTGQYGESTFRKVELESGKALRKLDFARKYFAEGSVIMGENLYILTWTNRTAFVYDAETLEYKKSYSYTREGWGLTTDGNSLIASDGSANLYFLDPGFKILKTVRVTLNSRPVRYLNELEWIDGKIWANVYMTDTIMVIDPGSGAVESMIDCSGILPDSLRQPSTDVLNGIAYDSRTGKIYITGKNWPRLYEIVIRKTNTSD